MKCFQNASRSRRLLVLTVQDTGCGIPFDLMPKVFEKVENVNTETGSRFGLFTIYYLVSSCNGGIHLSSEPGKGTRFIISLPIELEESEPSSMELSIPVSFQSNSLDIIPSSKLGHLSTFTGCRLKISSTIEPFGNITNASYNER